MQLIKYLAATAVGCVITLGFVNLQSKPQQPHWQLAYSHDKAGKALAGTKQALIDDIRAGKSVRIYWAGRRVEHLIDAHFLTVFGGEVFAQIAIQGQKPSKTIDPPTIELRDNPWKTIFATNGDRAVQWYTR